MPLIAVEGASVRCSHRLGRAKPRSSRPFLRINGRAVLVREDLPANAISWCPNYGVALKPCQTTLPLVSGFSRFVFADGRPVAFVNAVGPTDGVPPGVTIYSIRDPGQELVEAAG